MIENLGYGCDWPLLATSLRSKGTIDLAPKAEDIYLHCPLF